MFTKEHYIKIAKVLKERVPKWSFVHSGMVQAFVVMLEKDNKKFDAEKFLDEIYRKEKRK